MYVLSLLLYLSLLFKLPNMNSVDSERISTSSSHDGKHLKFDQSMLSYLSQKGKHLCYEQSSASA